MPVVVPAEWLAAPELELDSPVRILVWVVSLVLYAALGAALVRWWAGPPVEEPAETRAALKRGGKRLRQCPRSVELKMVLVVRKDVAAASPVASCAAAAMGAVALCRQGLAAAPAAPAGPTGEAPGPMLMPRPASATAAAERRWRKHLRWWNEQGVAKVALKTPDLEGFTAVVEAAAAAGLPFHVEEGAVCAVGPAPVPDIDAVAGHLKLLWMTVEVRRLPVPLGHSLLLPAGACLALTLTRGSAALHGTRLRSFSTLQLAPAGAAPGAAGGTAGSLLHEDGPLAVESLAGDTQLDLRLVPGAAPLVLPTDAAPAAVAATTLAPLLQWAGAVEAALLPPAGDKAPRSEAPAVPKAPEAACRTVLVVGAHSLASGGASPGACQCPPEMVAAVAARCAARRLLSSSLDAAGAAVLLDVSLAAPLLGVPGEAALAAFTADTPPPPGPGGLGAVAPLSVFVGATDAWGATAERRLDACVRLLPSVAAMRRGFAADPPAGSQHSPSGAALAAVAGQAAPCVVFAGAAPEAGDAAAGHVARLVDVVQATDVVLASFAEGEAAAPGPAGPAPLPGFEAAASLADSLRDAVRLRAVAVHHIHMQAPGALAARGELLAPRIHPAAAASEALGRRVHQHFQPRAAYLGTGGAAGPLCRPVGLALPLEGLSILRCDSGDRLEPAAVPLHALVAVCHRRKGPAAQPDADAPAVAADGNVAGFLIWLDAGSEYAHVIAPAPGPLPDDTVLLVGDVRVPPGLVPTPAVL